jgi:hypothetical protein
MMADRAKLPPQDAIVDAAVKAAAAQDATAAAAIMFQPAPPGMFDGGVKVDPMKGADGKGYVRLLIGTPVGLLYTDIPTEMPDGSNQAEQVGMTIVRCARQARSGILVV